jgi:hypothetical protein
MLFEALFKSKLTTNKVKIINVINRLIMVVLFIHIPPKRLKCFFYWTYLKNFTLDDKIVKHGLNFQ